MRFSGKALIGVAALSISGASFVGVVPQAHAATYAGECKQAKMYGGMNPLKVPVTKNWKSNNCWMDYGSTGMGVWALQMALNKCYGAHIAADGSFGPATRSALAAAQRREGITADGLYGHVTRKHLKFASVNEVTDHYKCGHRL